MEQGDRSLGYFRRLLGLSENMLGEDYKAESGSVSSQTLRQGKKPV